MILLLLLIASITSSSYIEVCEPFPIHHNFYNCEVLTRRGIYEHICPNQGTWSCSEFSCWREHADFDMDGYCLYGYLTQDSCCTHLNIHYVDMWVAPNNSSYTDDTEVQGRREILDVKNGPTAEWELEIYNINIMGVGPDIYIDSEVFADVYPNITSPGELIFVSVILRYNYSCHAWVEIYINATLVANASVTLDLWIGTDIRRMIDIPNWETNDQVYFISAHEIIPTLAQIEYLYGLGYNRSTEEEICHDTEHALCHGSCTSGMASDVYVTLTIIFGVIFGVLVCIILFFVLWWFIRRRTKEEEEGGEWSELKAF